MRDLLILGSGPAGLWLAKNMEGCDVAVATKGIGKPACSGLLSERIKDFFLPKSAIDNVIEGAVMHSPSGIKVMLKKKAYVVDRDRYDRLLAGEAKRAGAELLKNPETLPEAKMTADCSGTKRNCAFGVKALVRDDTSKSHCDVYYDRRFTDFYLWRLPRGKRTEYGIICRNPKPGKEKLLEFFNLDERVRLSAGKVALGPEGPSYGDGFIRVGDSAGQVKPFTFGGVIYSMICAEIASGVIKKCLAEGRFDSKYLSEYERLWKKGLEKDILAGKLLRGLMMHSPNNLRDLYFRLLSKRAGALSGCDMDMHSGIFGKLLRGR